MSGGSVWYRPSRDHPFEKTFALRHYGIGVGRGVRAVGIINKPDGTVFLGEYFRNRDRGDVRLYRSDDGGKTWETAHTFEAGQIKHIHAVQWDPYTDTIWVSTGDKDPECRIVWTRDGGKTLHTIGEGSQTWRSCMVAFTRDAIIWGSDTTPPNSGVFRWDRKTGAVTRLATLRGSSWFATRLAGGTLVVSAKDAPRKGSGRTARTSLWASTANGSSMTEIPCGLVNARGGGYSYLRFSRFQDNRDLWLTCVKIQGYNADLLVIPERAILERSRQLRTGPTASRPAS